VTTLPTGANLEWRPSSAPKVTGYEVYRAAGAIPWRARFQTVGYTGKAQTSFKDSDLRPGTVYTYLVPATSGSDQDPVPIARNIKVRAQPRVVEDAVVSVLSAKEVKLTWKVPANPDIAGYHVERAPVEVFTEDQIKRLKTDTPPLAEPSVGTVKAIGKFTRL